MSNSLCFLLLPFACALRMRVATPKHIPYVSTYLHVPTTGPHLLERLLQPLRLLGRLFHLLLHLRQPLHAAHARLVHVGLGGGGSTESVNVTCSAYCML